MVGETLGHYSILDKLGAGGMGEVYLAHDEKLDRKVAVKLLPTAVTSDPERLQRFEREAKTLAALDHPNIVHIYSVEEAAGRRFLTMQLVEGKTLLQLLQAGRLALGRIFEIAIPVADALAAAHDKGIVHRDLKPANIMIDDSGRVKILDFGLAKLHRPGAGEVDADAPTELLTEAGLVIGTVPYMSPEHIGDQPVDQRSDIFALGVILYEMVTGRRPFAGDSSGHIISAILRDEPDPVDTLREGVPSDLGRIIRRCLEKEPAHRYQSALDVKNELQVLRRQVDSAISQLGTIPGRAAPASRSRRWWPLAAAAAVALSIGTVWWLQSSPAPETTTVAETTATSGTGTHKIVVLPFANLGSPEDEYFAAGMTEEITSRLAGVRSLRVISRNSALRYAKTEKSIAEIGDELEVDYVLEGTVRWAKSADASRVRITPQLIQVSDDTHLWSETYDRVIDDVFQVQSEIADRVIDELGVTLLADEKGALESRPTENLEAYQAYLRGLDLSRQLDFEQQELALQMFERAVELDPEFTLAWAQLVRAYANRQFSSDFREDWLGKATTAMDRLRQLDSDDPSVRLAEGFYQYYGYQDYSEALEIFEEVVERSPSDAEALAARAYIYRRLGRMDEAIAELERALELDPQNLDYLSNLAGTYRGMRRFAEVDRYADRAIAVAPDQDGFYVLKADNLANWTGETAAAREVLERAPGSDELFGAWADLDCLDRDLKGALARLEAASPQNPFDRINLPLQMGIVHVYLGQTELARPHLESALQMLEEAMQAGFARGQLQVARAVVLALLGRSSEAIEEINHAIEATAKDRFGGPAAVEALVIIHALAGQPEPALDLLEELLPMSYSDPVTLTELRLHPIWDPLRDHPRFQALLREPN